MVFTAFSQTLVAYGRFLTNDEYEDHAFKGIFLLMSADLAKSNAFNLSFLSALLVVSGFFAIPLTVLLYVQSKNFLSGKTTMERYGRAGHDADTETRILNSGIRNDT